MNINIFNKGGNTQELKNGICWIEYTFSICSSFDWQVKTVYWMWTSVGVNIYDGVDNVCCIVMFDM